MMLKYDFIFSLGAACSCTQMLRKAQLQIASYPFDWLFGADLEKRIDIVLSHFERFLDIKDLSYVFSTRSISCDAYHNAFNDLTFNHDFASGKDLKETYPAVKEKYDRRIKRLFDKIEQAKTVLGVYIETPNSGKSKYTCEDLLKISSKLKTAFSDKQFDLLYVSPDTDLEHGKLVTNLSENGVTWIVTEYSYKKTGASEFAPDPHVLQKILKKYRLNLPLLFRLKRLFLRIAIRLVPIKSVRKNLRYKYKF